MYDLFAASCDQPIHLINIISISNLAMSLLKKNVFTFIYLYTMLPGLAYSSTI